MPSLVRSARRALALLLVVGAAGCGSAHLPPEAIPESPLATKTEDGKPRLTVVERAGDALPAAAIAVSHTANRKAAARVLSRLDDALRQAGLSPELSAFERGFVVSFDVPGGDAHALAVARKALLDPRVKAPERDFPVPFDPCFDGGGGEEAIALGATNVAFAVVGPGSFTSAWEDALADDAPWPVGGPVFDEWPDEATFSVVKAATDSLWIALRTNNTDKLNASASALSRSGAPLGRALAELNPGWDLETVHASARPLGGCLALEFKPSRAPGAREAVARAVVLIEDGLRAELNGAESSPLVEQALVAETAREAAANAAWQSLHRPADEVSEESDPALARAASAGPVRVTWFTRNPEATEGGELARAVGSQREPAPLKTTTRVDAGQGQVWLALSQRCPLVHETRETAGHTALALHALSAFSTEHTKLSVLMGHDGPALVAHGRVLQHGDLERLARDLQSSVLRALNEDAPFVEAQQAALASFEPHSLLELGANLLTDGNPSSLLPEGTEQSLAAARPELLRDALRTFLAGPLRLHVVANAETSQGDRLAQRLALLLSPFGAAAQQPCATASASPKPGQYGLPLSEADPPNTALLFYPVPAETLPAARALAALLNAPQGHLAESLRPLPGLNRAQATALGTSQGAAALVLEVRSDSALNGATAQLRGLIQALRGPPLSRADRLRAASASRNAVGGPLSRLADFIWPEDANPSEGISDLLRDHLSEDALILIVPAD